MKFVCHSVRTIALSSAYIQIVQMHAEARNSANSSPH